MEDINTLWCPDRLHVIHRHCQTMLGLSPSQLLPVELALYVYNSAGYCNSSSTYFSCYLAAERGRAWRRHSTASIKRSPKNHSVRAREAAHHHVTSSGWGRAAPKEPWWGLHVPRRSGDVVRWENTRWHVGGLEHAGHGSVSRLAHQSWRRDHGSLDRRHLLSWLHELLLLLLLLLLQSVVQARWPLQYLCWMQGPTVAFRVAELLVGEAGWALRAHLSLCRATLLHEIRLTLRETRERRLPLGLRHTHDLFDTWLLRGMTAALHKLHEELPAGIRPVVGPTAPLALRGMTVAEEILQHLIGASRWRLTGRRHRARRQNLGPSWRNRSQAGLLSAVHAIWVSRLRRHDVSFLSQGLGKVLDWVLWHVLHWWRRRRLRECAGIGRCRRGLLLALARQMEFLQQSLERLFLTVILARLSVRGFCIGWRWSRGWSARLGPPARFARLGHGLSREEVCESRRLSGWGIKAGWRFDCLKLVPFGRRQ